MNSAPVDFETVAASVRTGAAPAERFTDWLLSQAGCWVIIEGEFDREGRPISVRPLVGSHPSGANVSYLFTSEERASRYLAGLVVDPTARVSESPLWAALGAFLDLPIDGITINPESEQRLNTGRRQIEALRRLAVDAGV